MKQEDWSLEKPRFVFFSTMAVLEEEEKMFFTVDHVESTAPRRDLKVSRPYPTAAGDSTLYSDRSSHA